MADLPHEDQKTVGGNQLRLTDEYNTFCMCNSLQEETRQTTDNNSRNMTTVALDSLKTLNQIETIFVGVANLQISLQGLCILT